MTTYAVFGPREVRGELFTAAGIIEDALAEIPDLTKLVLGGGKGVETFAEDWAKAKKVPYQLVVPNIKLFGTRKAFDLRNTEMINVADKAVVFWDGTARATHELLSRIIMMHKVATVIPI